MKRLALVVPEYRTDQSGGGGVASVADFLLTVFANDPEWSIEIISPRMSHSAPENRRLFAPRTWLNTPRTTFRSDLSVPVIYVGSDWSELEFMRYRRRPALTRVLKNYDAILAVSGTPAICQAFVGVGIPVVAQVATLVRQERQRLIRTSTGLRKLQVQINTWLTSRIERVAITVPDILLVENAWMYAECNLLGAKRAEVHSPGVDTDRFAMSTVTRNKPGYIAMVGRLDDPRKDLPTLLYAFADAKRRHAISQYLVLAGRYAPRQSDLDLIDELGLAESVRIRTGLSEDQLVDLYQRADLFALTSEEEGLGIAILEAMSCGLPAVTTATEGALHIISDTDIGTVVEFGPDLVRHFSDAMARYANDESCRDRTGLRARHQIEERFSITSAGARFREIMNELA